MIEWLERPLTGNQGLIAMRRVSGLAAVAAAAIGIAAFAGPASATTFNGTFNITSDAASDPALVIVTNPALGTDSSPFNFNLSVGNTWTINSLFKIGTTEGAMNPDDKVAKDITVTFSFDQPLPPFGGPVTGETVGHSFLFFLNWGSLTWDAPINVAFGVDGLLGIKLFDTTFGLAHNGQVQWSDVKAEFTLLRDSAPVVTPLPAAVWLLGSVLAGGAGFGRWRKRKAKKAALAAA